MENERRKYPRIEVHLPLDLTLAGGERVYATALNLSRAGLQLTCDRRTALAIVPPGQSAVPGADVELDLCLALPAPPGTTTDVHAHCKVIGSVRQAENDFRIGLEYISFDGDDFRSLDAFIAKATY